jgi:hypothetical protein
MFAIAFIVFTVFVGVRVDQKNEIIDIQEQKIQDLNREIGEYQAMDSFWEEYMDLLDEIYRGKINEAVLNERVKWLEYNNIYDEDYVQQMNDDFEELIDVVIEYYETTNQSISLEVYVAQNYPALYDRIMSY